VLHAEHRRSEAAPFNLRAFIARVLSPFIRQASEKELQLTLTISNHVPGEITSDASRLEQLFRIILRSVMDAAKGGEISIEIDRDSIAISRSSDGAPQYFQLFINVAYRGPGIVANGNGIPRASSGAPFAESPLEGPALAVQCREVADLLGGTVRVEQDVSGGSFCFSLPIRCSKSATVRIAGGNNRLAAI
jgi:signal transduction histidine kinase